MDLKGKKVFVITCPELGWDCVRGVYVAESEKALIEYLGDEYSEDDVTMINTVTGISLSFGPYQLNIKLVE